MPAPELAPLRWKAHALIAGGSLAILAIAVWTAAAWPSDQLGFVFPPILVSVAAGLIALPLLLIPKVRQRRDVAPRWYIGRLYLLLATWPAAAILSASTLMAWLAGFAVATTLFDATLLVVVASGLLSIWSSIGLTIHALLRRPTPEPPPEAH